MNNSLKNEDIIKILSRQKAKPSSAAYEFNDIKRVRAAILNSPADNLFVAPTADKKQKTQKSIEDVYAELRELQNVPNNFSGPVKGQYDQNQFADSDTTLNEDELF